MLQDESTQALESSSSQIDLFNDLDLAVLGWEPANPEFFSMNHGIIRF